ncbi:hypothetical protein F2Q69_00002365 [Brassica cretica]|uniref:Uncharacterized protein n=1 Tax=Brassica cretica TaxID=69181 RepID=A0A8S9NXH5_BRACR|nr:hypothetical protein F2Q69_00002365 [Brassica cretica]
MSKSKMYPKEGLSSEMSRRSGRRRVVSLWGIPMFRSEGRRNHEHLNPPPAYHSSE